MTCGEKVSELRSKIEEALTPLITHDYWLLEVPYYNNIGDTLIWQGELDFLKGVKAKRKGMTSFETKSIPKIRENDLILFQGGGNFGDLWEKCHNYRKLIMRTFPKNRYVIFPQTVWYDDERKCHEDATEFANYDLTICARDMVSYNILKCNFKNRILLVPDMAFCIDMKHWAKSYRAFRPLFLKRMDKEFRPSAEFDALEALGECDVADWPTMMGGVTHYEEFGLWILRNSLWIGWLYNPFMQRVYRPYLIREGVKFINSHTDIYTTRLHACILSILLGKKRISFFDNSYGKNSGFYHTWLKDCDAVKMEK